MTPEQQHTSPEPDMGLDHLPPNPVYEESMRVSVLDPAAEKERKRMLDGLRRTSGQVPSKTGR